MISFKASLMALVSAVPGKIITTLLLPIARAILLLFTTCISFISSPQNFFFIMFHLVLIVLYVIHRFNSKHAEQTPLLSFPSLSRPLLSIPSLSKPLVSFASISVSQPLSSFRSIPRPLVSLPSISLKAIFKKDLVPPPDRVVPSAPPEPDQSMYVGRDDPDEEGSMSMEDTWKSILASSGAQPVKLKYTDEQDSALERVVLEAKAKNAAIRKKKEKRAKKIGESPEGWKQRDALVIVTHDDLTHRADAFIKKNKDLQRDEYNQRRQLVRLRITEK